MRYFIKPLVAALLACILMSSCGSRHLADGTSVAPYALRTDLLEYTDTDFGEGRFAFIKSGNPVFSWIVPSIGDSTVQLAYRITVNKLWPLTPPTESFGTVYKTVWDSGWVEGDSSVAVPFQGSALEPGSDYEWAVELKLANASGKRLKTSKSAYKRFKTDKTVCDYSTPSYPLVAERQAATAG